MSKLLFKPQVLKQLKKFPHTEQKKILKKIDLLKYSPSEGKPLKGEFTGLRSLRAWPYRIIYEYLEKADSVTIFSVAHRQGAYKN